MGDRFISIRVAFRARDVMEVDPLSVIGSYPVRRVGRGSPQLEPSELGRPWRWGRAPCDLSDIG